MNYIKIIILLIIFPIFKQFEIFSQTERKGVLWEYNEWEVENQTYSGNPFDIIAEVTFYHNLSGKSLKTQMFYDGNNTWKFRFTGTILGEWNFSTICVDKDLNNIRGKIYITQSHDTSHYGFLYNIGNKFAIQNSDSTLKGFLYNVYMNGYEERYSFRNANTEDFIDYLNEADEHGCTVVFSEIVANSWFNFPTISTDEGVKSNPDLTTFRKIEELLQLASSKNMLVHFWVWGDEQRNQTLIGILNGINGEEDKRLIRYMAARLGPLPNWVMGYGFDLHEWTNKAQVEEWINYFQEHVDYQHLFSARGIKSTNPNIINSYDGFGREETDLYSTQYGPKDYFEIFEDLNSDLTKPHLYEERHSYLRPNFNLDMDGTRRLMWWETMAGGMGGWFGIYNPSSSSYVTHPYPNPEMMKTHKTFWLDKNRFLWNLKVDNNLSNGFAVSDSENENTIIYKENTNIISFLNIQLENQKIIAVDTKLKYKEINISEDIIKNLWVAPYKSDWTVAIGDFRNIKKYELYSDLITDTADTIINIIKRFIVFKNTDNINIQISIAHTENLSFIVLERSKNKVDWDRLVSYSINDSSEHFCFIDNINSFISPIYYRVKLQFSNGLYLFSYIVEPTIHFDEIELIQNYPNPFNAYTNIEFYLPDELFIKLKVYNSLGELMETLFDGLMSSGFHKIKLNAKNYPSGMYIYTLKSGKYFNQKKMLLLK